MKLKPVSEQDVTDAEDAIADAVRELERETPGAIRYDIAKQRLSRAIDVASGMRRAYHRGDPDPYRDYLK